MQPLVTEVIKYRRWRFLGHVLRIPDNRLPKTTFQWNPGGSRRRGRRMKALRRTYEKDRATINTAIVPNWADVLAAAHLREEWRSLTDALWALDGAGGKKAKVFWYICWYQNFVSYSFRYYWATSLLTYSYLTRTVLSGSIIGLGYKYFKCLSFDPFESDVSQNFIWLRHTLYKK